MGLGLTVARMMHWEWVGRECPYNYQIKLCGEQSAIQCNAMMIGLVLPMVKQRAGLIFILIILEIFCFCNFGCSEISIFLRLSTKKSFLAKTQRFWAQKGPLWVIGAMKRPAERPPTGKPPKASRVNSVYGGLMIPLSRVRRTSKYGGYMGAA